MSTEDWTRYGRRGEMTVDVGRARLTAKAGSIVPLPPSVAHRNFNASGAVERHVLLVPEPQPGEVFDYALDIHEREAELLKAIPA